jgi:hypothetical protein
VSRQPETVLVARIRRALVERYGADGKWVKIHGSEMQEQGLPDILGCLRGRAVALEVKMPGEGPTPLQAFRLAEYARAGAVASVVYSADQAIALLDELPSG